MPPTRRVWFGMGAETAHGNGFLRTGLPREGVLLAYPRFVQSDGSVAMKWPWYRTVPGIVTIEGRRLDAPAPPMPTVVLRGPEDGYGETGFHPSGLVFPEEGCWQVTATLGEHSLTFVTYVAKVPFEPMRTHWLPGELKWQATDFDLPPDSIREIYGLPDGRAGFLMVETHAWKQQLLNPYPGVEPRAVAVHGSPGVCVRVGWAEGAQWRADPNASALAWRARGLTYSVTQVGLGLSCEDLLRTVGAVP